MDFIERWFHISPDGGNGTLEAFYIIAVFVVIIVALVRLRNHLLRLFLWYLEQLGKRGSGDRFDP
jgi:hypothetical protein